MPDSEPRPPIHEIAMELRDAMDDLLPDGVGVTMNTSENADGTGSVNLTVASWPKGMFMLNRDRIIIQRRALLNGHEATDSELNGHPYLSPEASHLAEILQTLIDNRFPPITNSSTGELEWPITGGVIFDPRALERERIEIIQSLKTAMR